MRLLEPTSWVKRAREREGESFSPPIVRRRAARAVDSLVGIPWEKMRIMLELLRLSSPTGEPTMSFARWC